MDGFRFFLFVCIVWRGSACCAFNDLDPDWRRAEQPKAPFFCFWRTQLRLVALSARFRSAPTSKRDTQRTAAPSGISPR